jgi:ribose-phosphate pyrophosphokinase
MKIFSGSANVPLAEKIATHLGLSLSSRELFIFPDGERRVWIEEEVLDEDCILIQPTTTPVDEHYMELFFLIDGLKRSGARSVTVVMPYIGYQRQDHIFRSGEAVSLEVAIKLLESLKIDRIIFVDPHTIKIPDMFTIPVSDLSALPVFAKEIERNNWIGDDTVLVTPDMGGIRRIEILSRLLSDMPFISVEKNRDLATGNLEVSQFTGEVKKRCLITDDMASSGKTLVQAAELMKSHGAEEIYAFVTHAVFSEDAPDLLQNSIIEKIYVTDSVLVPEEKKFAKLHILSLSEMIAHEIKHPMFRPIE